MNSRIGSRLVRLATTFVSVSALVVSIGCGGDDGGGDGDGDNDISVEAEAFDMAVPDGLTEWVELNDSAASGTRYIAILNGLADTCNPDPAQVEAMCRPKVSFDINIPSAGDYYIYVRGRGQDSGLGAAWAYFDTSPATLFAWPENNNRFRFAENVSTSTTLTAGAHTLNLALSEDGTGVDRLVVSTSSESP